MEPLPYSYRVLLHMSVLCFMLVLHMVARVLVLHMAAAGMLYICFICFICFICCICYICYIWLVVVCVSSKAFLHPVLPIVLQTRFITSTSAQVRLRRWSFFHPWTITIGCFLQINYCALETLHNLTSAQEVGLKILKMKISQPHLCTGSLSPFHAHHRQCSE